MQFFDKTTLNIEYGKVSEMMKLTNREITSVDEYIKWVREWRHYHHGLVNSIQTLRAMKIAIRDGVMAPVTASKINDVNHAQGSKLNLRPFAKALHDLRVERKAKFKAGVYGDPTFKHRQPAEAVAA